jgi:hypothetical protein
MFENDRNSSKTICASDDSFAAQGKFAKRNGGISN